MGQTGRPVKPGRSAIHHVVRSAGARASGRVADQLAIDGERAGAHRLEAELAGDEGAGAGRQAAARRLRPSPGPDPGRAPARPDRPAAPASRSRPASRLAESALVGDDDRAAHRLRRGRQPPRTDPAGSRVARPRRPGPGPPADRRCRRQSGPARPSPRGGPWPAAPCHRRCRIEATREQRDAVGARQARHGLQQQQMAAVTVGQRRHHHHLGHRRDAPALRQSQHPMATHALGVELAGIDPATNDAQRPAARRDGCRCDSATNSETAIIEPDAHAPAASRPPPRPGAARSWQRGDERERRRARGVQAGRGGRPAPGRGPARADARGWRGQPAGIAPRAQPAGRVERHRQMGGPGCGQLTQQRSRRRCDQGAPARARRWRAISSVRGRARRAPAAAPAAGPPAVGTRSCVNAPTWACHRAAGRSRLPACEDSATPRTLAELAQKCK